MAVPVFRQASRARLLDRLAALPASVWLSALVVASVGARFLLALWIPAPWIFVDELKYSELAKSFGSTGHFAIREAAGRGVGPLYPIAIAPAYAIFDNLPHAYVLVKAINSVLMALAAVPTYLLARRLLAKPWSLVAAALALAVPSMVYTGMVMTESLFYPLFLLASLGIVRALERPSAGRQLVALGVIGLALATRAEAVALLAALVTAIVAMCAVDAAEEHRRLRALRRCLARYTATWVGLAGGLAGLIGLESARGRSPFALFGDAQGLWHQHYSLTEVARWFLYHLAELDLYVGVLPFAAFLVLATFAWSRRDRPLRIFAIASLSIVFWLLLTVAVFTSSLTRYDPHADSHVIDRYTFYVVPLLLIALLAWITQRAPGSGRKAAVAALLAGGLVLALPYKDLIHDNSVPDTLGFLPWSTNRHGSIVAMPHVAATVGVISLSLAGLFYLLRPPRLPFVAPLLVFLLFFTAFGSAQRWYHLEGAAASPGPRHDWIDAAIGQKAEAVVIWSGRGRPHLIWENEFFNRSVGRVYYLREPSWAGLPEQKLIVRRRSGLLVDEAGRPLRARFALVDPWVVLRGRIVARERTSGMRLYRLTGPSAQISAQ